MTKALPLWGRRPKAGGGGFRIVDPGCGWLPTTPPSVGFADTSPIGGGL